MLYQLLASGAVQREDGAVIPADPQNRDYAEFLAWQAAGNTPTPIPVPTLDAIKAQQTASVREACQQAIFAGFASDALGASHTYPAKATDQTNLQASVLASLLPGNAADWTTPFWCADASGAWAYVSHTAVQIQQAGRDGKAAILAALVKCQSLEAAISAATAPAQVQAVLWQ